MHCKSLTDVISNASTAHLTVVWAYDMHIDLSGSCSALRVSLIITHINQNRHSLYSALLSIRLFFI
jgi:hypothetical protein